MTDYNELENLANQGLNNQEISQALGVSTRKFYNLKNDNALFAQAVENGKLSFRNTIRQSILNKANKDKDSSLLIHLSKKLNLFVNDFNKTTLTDPTSALEALNSIYTANISVDDKKAYTTIIQQFISVYESSVLEQRIVALEHL